MVSIFSARTNTYLASFCLGLGILYSLSPWGNAANALIFGVMIALLFGNPFSDKTKQAVPTLLAYSVIGLFPTCMGLGVPFFGQINHV
jgi:hypothetical protein